MNRFYNGELDNITIEWRKVNFNTDPLLGPIDNEVRQIIRVNENGDGKFTRYTLGESGYPEKSEKTITLSQDEKDTLTKEILDALEKAIPENLIEDLESNRDYTVILENKDGDAFIYPIPDNATFEIDKDNVLKDKINEDEKIDRLYVLDIGLIDLNKNLDFIFE